MCVIKKLVLPLALALVLLCSCASRYVLELHNGQQITCIGKPKLKGASYEYKDAKGTKNLIPQSRVREIAPASVAAEEDKFKVSKPKQHWWQFWR